MDNDDYEEYYNFAKDFVTAALKKQKSLENAPGTSAKVTKIIASVVPGGLYFTIFGNVLVPLGVIIKVMNLVVEAKDTQNRKKKEQKILAALNKQIKEDEMALNKNSLGEEIFIRVFVDAAVEIFLSFENQLKVVKLVVDGESDNLQGRSHVAKKAAKLCLRQITKAKSIENITKVISQLDKWSDYLKSKKDKNVKSPLIIPEVDLKMSAYEFLQTPIPAWTTVADQEKAHFPDNSNFKDLWIPNKAKKTFLEKYKQQGIFLRRPTNFEMEKHKENKSNTLVSISVQSIKNYEKTNLDKVKWCPEERSEKIYQKLICDDKFDFKSAVTNSLDKIKKEIQNILGLLEDVKQGQEELKSGQQNIKDCVATGNEELRNIMMALPEEILKYIDDLFSRIPPTGNSTVSGFGDSLRKPTRTFNTCLALPVESHTRIFIGRKEIIDSVVQKFLERNSNRTIVITAGLGGVGKTELARQIIIKLTKENYLMFWIDAQTFLGIFKAMKKVGRTLNIQSKVLEVDEKDMTEDNTAEYQQYLKELSQEMFSTLSKYNRKSLFIFDNAENQQQIYGFLPLLMIDNPPAILITSRTQNWTAVGKIVDIKGFSDAETLEYFTEYFQLTIADLSSNLEQTRQFLKAVQRLWTATGGYTLTIVMAASYIHTSYSRNIKGIEEGIEDLLEKPNLDELDGNRPLGYEETRDQIFTKTFCKIQKKSEFAGEILRQMSYLTPDFITVKLCCQLFQSEEKVINKIPGKIRRGLVVLRDFSIIYLEQGPEIESKIWIHRVVQDFIRKMNEDDSSCLMNLAKSLNVILSGQDWSIDLIPHVESVEEALKIQFPSPAEMTPEELEIVNYVTKRNALKKLDGLISTQLKKFYDKQIRPLSTESVASDEIKCPEISSLFPELGEISLGRLPSTIFKYLTLPNFPELNDVVQILCEILRELIDHKIYPAELSREMMEGADGVLTKVYAYNGLYICCVYVACILSCPEVDLQVIIKSIISHIQKRDPTLLFFKFDDLLKSKNERRVQEQTMSVGQIFLATLVELQLDLLAIFDGLDKLAQKPIHNERTTRDFFGMIGAVLEVGNDEQIKILLGHKHIIEFIMDHSSSPDRFQWHLDTVWRLSDFSWFKERLRDMNIDCEQILLDLAEDVETNRGWDEIRNVPAVLCFWIALIVKMGRLDLTDRISSLLTSRSHEGRTLLHIFISYSRNDNAMLDRDRSVDHYSYWIHRLPGLVDVLTDFLRANREVNTRLELVRLIQRFSRRARKKTRKNLI